MDQYVLSYCVIYRMDKSVLNSVFFKKIYVAMGITTVLIDVDNSYVTTAVDEIIMPVTTVIL
jgi:hypothetical protein